MKEQEDIIESLMANKDFRDWVLNPSEDRNVYWEKWIKAHKEHKEAVGRARNRIAELRFKEDYLDEEELEEILNNVISNKPSSAHRRFIPSEGLNMTWWLKIAATFLIAVLSIYFFRYMLNNTERAPKVYVVELKKASNPDGRRSRIKLPDGTIVNLNAESTLLFPEQFSDTLRQVELAGEAFFDVVRDESRPFIVKTNNIETKVLGTSFNVRAFQNEEEINVALVSGKVNVSESGRYDDEKDYILMPGEKLTYNKAESSYEKNPFNITEETGWKDEILVFKNTDFQGFVKQLERWYGVRIKVVGTPGKHWNVNGHFKSETLEEVLVGVQFTYEIDYVIEGKDVTLKCN